SFLPSEAESQRAATLESSRFGAGHQMVEVVIVDPRGISATDQTFSGQLRDWLGSRPRSDQIQSVSPAFPTPDDEALLIQVTFSVASTADVQADAGIAAIEAHLKRLSTPPGVQVGVTGAPVTSHDIAAGIGGSSATGRPGLLRLISILIIAVVLALVYR